MKRYSSLVYDFTDEELYELAGRTDKRRADETIFVSLISNNLRLKHGVLQQAIEVTISYPSYDTVMDAKIFRTVWVNVPEVGDKE